MPLILVELRVFSASLYLVKLGVLWYVPQNSLICIFYLVATKKRLVVLFSGAFVALDVEKGQLHAVVDLKWSALKKRLTFKCTEKTHILSV
jgi:hypothetical protein